MPISICTHATHQPLLQAPPGPPGPPAAPAPAANGVKAGAGEWQVAGEWLVHGGLMVKLVIDQPLNGVNGRWMVNG